MERIGPRLRKHNLVIRVLAWSCFKCEKKNWCRTLYFVFPCFFLIIMKSLQLRGHKQISESHKYCLVRVIVFFGVYFLYFFCFS